MNQQATRADALKLLMDGAIALAQIESNGIRVDLDYLDATVKKIDLDVRELTASMRSDKVWKVWQRRYGETMNLGSDDQMGTIIFKDLGYPNAGYTAASFDENGDMIGEGRFRSNEAAFANIDLPFVKNRMRMKKWNNAKSRMLSLRRETVDGLFHPSFNLHLARSYRSSSGADREGGGGGEWNFQNIPKRNPEIGEMLRRCFIPRKGHVLVERDFKGIEVRIAATLHKDPVMLEYIKDTSKDMHRDMAMQIYFLEQDQVTDQVRDVAKGAFVFAQFYGDYYVHCAAGLWGPISTLKLKTTKGVGLNRHLAKHGIKNLEQFTEHVRSVEQDFWGKRFKVYAECKKLWWEDYLRKGYFDLVTGFRVTGLGLGDEGESKRNACINYRIQGPAFHCLLWTLTRAQHTLMRQKWQSKLLGQIHDSALGDIHESELDDYLTMTDDLVERRLPKAWPWINIPMQIDAAVGKIDGSWFELKKWMKKEGQWQPKN